MVDDEGAINAPFPQREIIDADDAWIRSGRRRGGAQDAQERIPARGQPQTCGQACAGFAARGKADIRQAPSEAHGALSMRRGQVGQALGKCAPRALRSIAEEPADVQAEPYRLSGHGQIAHDAPIAAMDAD